VGISPEQANNWPNSRRLADAIPVAVAVVYTVGDGLAAEWASSEQEADARAVEFQRAGHRAWFVILEDDGWGMVGPPAALGRENTGKWVLPTASKGTLTPYSPKAGHVQ
jgi:hypothetical protein